MMELIFVRHALPVRGEAGAVEMADPVLSPLGERQSERLTNALHGQPFSEVVCSPAVRAVHTARPLLQDRRLQPRIEPDLLEYCPTRSRTSSGARATPGRWGRVGADFSR